ncbi:hypothetical protein [Paucihalobacter ruber]|uniref:hypothetical protein n=1 Tax=Paucihalobacter ruber TaxID=2567861 RepID=UPI001C1EC2D6|nr:hypothetical protein [Paucihalobacter ruber]
MSLLVVNCNGIVLLILKYNSRWLKMPALYGSALFFKGATGVFNVLNGQFA